MENTDRRSSRRVSTALGRRLEIERSKTDPRNSCTGAKYNGTDRENSQYEVVSSPSITLRRPCEVARTNDGNSVLVLATFSEPQRLCSRRSCVVVAEPVRWSMARRASGSARPIRCPVAMRRLRASRSTHPPHLPVGAPRPSGRELGRSRDRTSAIRPSRVDMCGRACTTRTRAAARARMLREESASCLAGSAV